jgi:hypothetical protein
MILNTRIIFLTKVLFYTMGNNFHGPKFVSSMHARDLGISHSAGKCRPNVLPKRSLTQSKFRIKTIVGIGKISRKARKLHTGSAFAMSSWGHQAAGLSDHQMIEMEGDALSCTGINQSGRCRAIALFVSLGFNGTPRARIVRETVREWLDFLKESSPQAILGIRVAWIKAREHLLDNNCNVSGVRGMMFNMG